MCCFRKRNFEIFFQTIIFPNINFKKILKNLVLIFFIIFYHSQLCFSHFPQLALYYFSLLFLWLFYYNHALLLSGLYYRIQHQFEEMTFLQFLYIGTLQFVLEMQYRLIFYFQLTLLYQY